MQVYLYFTLFLKDRVLKKGVHICLSQTHKYVIVVNILHTMVGNLRKSLLPNETLNFKKLTSTALLGATCMCQLPWV